MLHDPIVDEVRKAREDLAAEFDYDLHRIFEFLADRQRESPKERISNRRITERNLAEDDRVENAG